MCDVAIVGAGPGGCAAALTIATYANLDVVLIERDQEIAKAGEVLAPGIEPLMDYLKIDSGTPGKMHDQASSIASSWGGDTLIERPYLFTGGMPARHLDRAQFEHQLRAAAGERGVDLHHARLRSFERSGIGWRLAIEDGTGAQTIGSRFLIDATGRTAAIARDAGAKQHVADRMVALWRKGSLRADKDPNAGGATLLEGQPDGWWYSAAVPADGIVAGFFTDADLCRTHKLNEERGWEMLVEQSRHTASRLARSHSWGPIRVRPIDIRYLAPAHGGDWIACGDAALTVDPLSSMGISLAMLSGIQAGRVAAAACQGVDVSDCGYSDEIARLHREHCDQRTHFYRQETRWPECPFWSTRRPHDQASAQVAVGLGAR